MLSRKLRVTQKNVSRRNITLALEEDLLQEARVLAAKRGLSVSALLRQQLESLVQQELGYAAARATAVKRLQRGAKLGGGRLPKRQELHDRVKLR